jgi:para-aminobenzoate N-oxygenase AurF
MVSDVIDRSERFQGILNRLSEKSIDDYYNPYKMFEWPDELPNDMWWMSPELTTTYGTELAKEFSQEQLFELSRLESVNFYSLNVHGIRELLVEVVNRIHTPGFEAPSEFFHHFVGEENEHMWFFAEFCLRYGKKIYRQPPAPTSAAPSEKLESLLVFARIVIFEELVDHYNSRMAVDDRLHETVRGINRIHHQDESRHIAFGRELVQLLYSELKQSATEAELVEVSDYLKRYMRTSFESLYHPQVYRDAGLPNPHEVRRALLDSPARVVAEENTFRKTSKFLLKAGIIR